MLPSRTGKRGTTLARRVEVHQEEGSGGEREEESGGDEFGTAPRRRSRWCAGEMCRKHYFQRRETGCCGRVCGWCRGEAVNGLDWSPGCQRGLGALLPSTRVLIARIACASSPLPSHCVPHPFPSTPVQSPDFVLPFSHSLSLPSLETPPLPLFVYLGDPSYLPRFSGGGKPVERLAETAKVSSICRWMWSRREGKTRPAQRVVAVARWPHVSVCARDWACECCSPTGGPRRRDERELLQSNRAGRDLLTGALAFSGRCIRRASQGWNTVATLASLTFGR